MKTLAAMAFIAFNVFGQSAPRTVYVLPMANGLDQYLAQRLSSDHVMKVVADPKIADVVLTDRLDEAFEQKLTEIRAADAKKDDKDKDDTRTHAAFRSSKGKGTIFLVDAKSREVLWSDYEKVPVSSSSDILNREAERIAKKLQAAGL
ncbi:MAG TPA: hypothetical protein VGL72_23960 [Bryobacteraceae bacterium]|jgi:hypothetical protein